MSRRVYVALAIYAAAAVILAVTLGITAIWLDSQKLGGTCGVLGSTGFFSSLAFSIWSDFGAPERLLSRDARKALRRDLDRIALDKAIRDAEREAGIR